MDTIALAEKRWLPDWMIRFGIRRLLAKRLQLQHSDRPGSNQPTQSEFVDQLRQSPLAVETDAANSQHYEVPSEFFQWVLGPRLKYSCCFFEHERTTLAQAEEAMLDLTCKRSQLEDGQRILELGCGWGSLTLRMAEQYPSSRITAVSNSHSQRKYIQGQAAERGLANLNIVTANMRDFSTSASFDRVVSVEMFEHMRNYELLMERISNWLTPEGRLFVHIFCHRHLNYVFETEGRDNWMGRHFFTGGIMPSATLLTDFQQHLQVCDQWEIDGNHYWRTSECWLDRMDEHRESIESLFGRSFSPNEAKLMTQRWRMFFLACAELFRYNNGSEWFVSHYLFARK